LERTEILALSIDDREHQQMMVERVAEDDGRTIEFRLISDPDHAVIDRYGLLNQQDPRQRPIPHPTVLVIDREGVVRWKFIEINYKIRPTNEDILGALADLHGMG
jgi:peroxiredoxin